MNGSRRQCCCRSGSTTARRPRASGRHRYDKVRLKTEEGNRRVCRSRLPRGAGRDRADQRVHRTRRRADAELRQRGCPCRRGHDDRHLGDRRQLRADRCPLPHQRRHGDRRRAGAVAGEPTIIEDDCFIGARSEVAEGVIVERGSVLSMGVFLSGSTKSSTGCRARCSWAGCRRTRSWCRARCPRATRARRRWPAR